MLNTIEGSEWEITVSKNTTAIEINVGLHPRDVDRFHEVISQFIITCEKTKKHIKNFNEEENARREEGEIKP